MGKPSRSAVARSISSCAEAPSDNWLALPAVTKRPSLMIWPSFHTGFSRARPSNVVSARMPSSLSSVTFSLPLIVPSIMSAFLISFVFSIDEVVIASFIAGDQPTYPVYLYSGLKFPEKTQTLIPVATVMIVLSFALAIMAEVIRRRGDRKLRGL